MKRRESLAPAPRSLVAAGAATALTLVYSAPTPGTGSRYRDEPAVAHESRLLSVAPVRDAVAGAGDRGVGTSVLEAVRSSRSLSGFSDPRSAGYLVPLARAALLGLPARRVLSGLAAADVEPFARALETSGDAGPLGGALRIALGGESRETTLREVVRFTAARDALSREYARDYEVTRGLAEPALLSSLSRAESTRASVVQAYMEVLSEVPDLEVTRRAGSREAEDVSRMANGVLKAGGAHSRRGLQALSNLDGLIRSDPRLTPSATEPPVVAAAFLVSLAHGPEALTHRLHPAPGG